MNTARANGLSPTFSLITPPSLSVVTLAEAKLAIGASGTTDDDLITSLIDVAVSDLEGRAGRLGTFIRDQKWGLSLREWPCDRFIILPFSPVQSVVVKYLSPVDGSSQVFSSTNYSLLAAVEGPAIFLADGASWPSVGGAPNAITIEAQVGYALAASVPSAIKTAIKLIVADLYSSVRRADAVKRKTIEGVGAVEYDVTGMASKATNSAIDRLLSNLSATHGLSNVLS